MRFTLSFRRLRPVALGLTVGVGSAVVGCGQNPAADTTQTNHTSPSAATTAADSATAPATTSTTSPSTATPAASRSATSTSTTSNASAAPAFVVPSDVPLGAPPSTNSPATSASAIASAPQVAIDPKYTKEFAEVATMQKLDGQLDPEKFTLTQKPIPPLCFRIIERWNTIPLVSKSTGQPLKMTAKIHTDLGTIEIALRPDLAPNHVRHFLALVQEKYYDGLLFERVIQQENLNGPNTPAVLTAGCPVGRGDIGIGHIGYFMLPEFPQEVVHEAGTVGIWHDEHPASAGCRFYIALGPAPWLDKQYTVIGKVTQGLDLVQKIARLPLKTPNSPLDNGKPENPVVMKKVEIVVEGMDNSAPVAQNQ